MRYTVITPIGRTVKKRPKARYMREVYMKPINRERLAKRRKDAGYTQRELAMLCRCTQAAISGLETGNMPNCSEALAEEIARRLDREVEELFTAHDGQVMHRVTNARGSKRQTSIAA